MFGFKNSPLHRFVKPRSVGSTVPSKMSYNPFDSDDELDEKPSHSSMAGPSSRPSPSMLNNPFDSDDELDKKPSHRPTTNPSSRPLPSMPNSSTKNPFDDDDVEDKENAVRSSGSKQSLTYAQRNRYKNDFRDLGGVDSQSVEELENYAVYKAEETTKTVKNSVKIAEEIREDATKTLTTLHHQGEQITRTHNEAANIDYYLARGEKLLGSLGGIFSKRWKPRWTPPIKGPAPFRDDPVRSTGNHLEQRENLGLTALPSRHTKSRTPPPEPKNTFQKIEVEKMKQDDALSDLSNLIGELKVMAIDMGSEIDRHNKALDRVDDDVRVLNERVGYANQRGRQLLRK